jgi:hypothetical protein
MKASQLGQPQRAPLFGHDLFDRLQVWMQRKAGALHTDRKTSADKEPQVEQLVDLIMATPCGESCRVRLDPRRTHIENMRGLLPICLQSLRTQVAIREIPDGDDVVLAIRVVERRGQRMPVSLGEVAVGALAF